LTFDEFVRAELGALSRFSGALTGDRYLAEDMLSDALLKVARKWRRIATMDDPAAYVRQIVVNTYLDDRRKARRRRTEPTSHQWLLDQPAPTVVPDVAAEVVARAEVTALLARLPARQKAAVVLRYLLDETDDEIARALGCSPGTVRSHLSRARATLRLAAGPPRPDTTVAAPAGRE
jgi:RNA polymerase sigma-70 factor (sigma-E family)